MDSDHLDATDDRREYPEQAILMRERKMPPLIVSSFTAV